MLSLPMALSSLLSSVSSLPVVTLFSPSSFLEVRVSLSLSVKSFIELWWVAASLSPAEPADGGMRVEEEEEDKVMTGRQVEEEKAEQKENERKDHPAPQLQLHFSCPDVLLFSRY